VSDAQDLYTQIEQDRRHRLRLSLEASRLPGLLSLLDAAAGSVLGGHYRIDCPLAVGSQFIVWMAMEISTERPIILKQGRFDYRHPVRYGRGEVNRNREAIRREYEVLWADRSGTLPRPLVLLVADSPVPAAAASPVLARDEVFVAQEYIRGLTITELALRVWPIRPAPDRERAVARLAEELLTFWEVLHAAGWFYGDMSADNLLVERSGRLRMVDAGNAVPVADQIILTGFTPAFTSPRIFAAATQGLTIPGTLASILPSFGKVLHFALTGHEQFNGHLPNLDDPILGDYSSHCRLVMEMLAEVDERPEKGRDARIAVARWRAAAG
jgi:serine/threonine protein kinase